VVFQNIPVPFQLELATNGTGAQAWFFNGTERSTSTGGSFDKGALKLQFGQFATRLEATLKDGVLDGTYFGDRRTGSVKFHAERAKAKPAADPNAPQIGGEWILPVKSGKGETAWRFLVDQNGSDVKATILRVDGDTGALTGRYANGKFTLSHFSGQRPAVMEITPQADGTLALAMNVTTKYTAIRPAQAQAQGVAPTDPNEHTSVQNPAEPFKFSFKDVNGNVVSNTDAKFKGKVMMISMTGSWCPNCHDEAPYLAELYRTYRGKGLEIVAMSFEEEEQLADPVRLKAFIKSYGIDYTVLVPGVPDEATQKLPQLKNFNAWPTILVFGRDGKFRNSHAGFPSDGSGAIYKQTKKEIAANVEKLLAEK
jgi:thiol-disulfide isomerase/thioredoxin